MIITKPPLVLYFGDSSDCLFPAEYLALPDEPILELNPFAKLQKSMGLESLSFLHQVHGIEGVEINSSMRHPKPFTVEGDFLITNIRNVGLGVVTADCLPVIMYDPAHGAIGIAHAGWPGSAQGIAAVMLEKMQQCYGTQADQLQIFLGPSAKPCCYKVDQKFMENFKDFPNIASVVHERKDGLYFDLPGFNCLQLGALGVPKAAINIAYNICTMCTKRYCSYRMQKDTACRQMTVVSLS